MTYIKSHIAYLLGIQESTICSYIRGYYIGGRGRQKGEKVYYFTDHHGIEPVTKKIGRKKGFLTNREFNQYTYKLSDFRKYLLDLAKRSWKE